MKTIWKWWILVILSIFITYNILLTILSNFPDSLANRAMAWFCSLSLTPFQRVGNFWYHSNLFQIVTMEITKHRHQTGTVLNKCLKWLQTSACSQHWATHLPLQGQWAFGPVRQLWWEGALGCTAVGGEAHWLRAGSLHGIVHGIYPGNKADKYSQWPWPIRRPGLLSKLSTEKQNLYSAFHGSCSSLVALSCPNHGQHSQGIFTPAGNILLLLLMVRTIEPHLK